MVYTYNCFGIYPKHIFKGNIRYFHVEMFGKSFFILAEKIQIRRSMRQNNLLKKNFLHSIPQHHEFQQIYYNVND